MRIPPKHMTAACDARFWKIFVPFEVFRNTKLSDELTLLAARTKCQGTTCTYPYFSQMMVAEE